MQYFIRIGGIDYIFTESAITFASGDPYESTAQVISIAPQSIRLSARSIDRDLRRVNGGGFAFSLVRDSAGVIDGLLRFRSTTQTTLAGSTILRSTSMTGTGIITVNKTTGYASSGTLYINSETFTYTGKTSTTFTGVTRSIAGSAAQPHFAGDPVFAAPRFWRGRRAKLYAVDVDGVSQLVAIGDIDASPQPSEGMQYNISCRGAEDTFAQRTVFFGYRPVSLVASQKLIVGKELQFEDDEFFLFRGGTTANKFVRVTAANGDAEVDLVYSVASVDTGAKTITLGSHQLGIYDPDVDSALFDRFIQGNFPSGAPINPDTDYASTLIRRVMPILYLRGDPAEIMLKLLVSKYGSGTGYDVLMGNQQSATSPVDHCRMGCGFTESYVDTDALEALVGKSPLQWTVYIDEETQISQLLEEFCILTNTFWQVNQISGAITFQELPNASFPDQTLVATLTDSTRDVDDAEQAQIDDSSVVPVVEFECGFNLLSKSHDVESLAIVDDLLVRSFPDNDRKKLTLRYSDVLLPITPSFPRVSKAVGGRTVLEGIARALQRADGRADIVVKYSGDRLDAADIGQIVHVTNERIPDFDGGTIDHDAVIEELSIDLETGGCNASLRILENGLLIAPFALLSSASGTTVNFITTDFAYEQNQASKPARQFAVGWSLSFYDESAGTRVVRTISSITDDDTIVISSSLGFTPQAGVDWCTIDDYDTAQSGSSASGFEVTDVAFMSDGESLGATEDGPHKYQ